MNSGPSPTASVFQTGPENAFEPSTTQQQSRLTYAYERQHNAGSGQVEDRSDDRSP